MADGKFTPTTATSLRKVNEIIMSVRQLNPPEKLFDEFWREGELALMFGPRGTGKSILAMQVAERLARGKAIDGFAMSEKRHKVLYVDLKLSERQFGMRYTSDGKQFKLSENLYRDRPASNDKLCEWLRGAIRDKGFRVIVIDDLSAIRQTYDGTRETLKLMRDLKQLKDELDVSILVIAGSNEQRRGELISETHMMRSRVLCDAADSVFALGVHAGNADWRYLVQTRSVSSGIKWNVNNGPACRIKRFEDGFLGFTFDERFVVEIDEETRQSICNIKWRRDAGASYREIADELGIAKSTAFRLHKKWSASLEKNIVVEPEEKNEPIVESVRTQECNEKEEWEECGFEKPSWLESEPPASAGGNDRDPNATPSNQIDGESEPALLPPAYAGGSDTEPANENGLKLKRGFDGYGNEIFIEKEYEHNGKPIIWYDYDSKKRLRRYERDVAGIAVTMVEGPLKIVTASISLGA